MPQLSKCFNVMRLLNDMMRLFSIIYLLISLQAQSQEAQTKLYKSKNDVISRDSIRLSDIIGEFTRGDLYEIYTYSLLPNRTYIKTGISDIPDYPKPDSGHWTLKGKNKLILYTRKRKITLKMLKIGDYCFLIFPDQKKSFNDELNKAFQGYKEAQTISLENQTNATLFLIGQTLSKKFFARRLAPGA